jgi:uncharacterized Zn-finger protein
VQALDISSSRSKIPENSGEIPSAIKPLKGTIPDCMTAKSPVPRQNAEVKPPCKHPRVQIVSRDEDSEFVECTECGEIFESSEFKDMNIEERAQKDDA